MTTYAFVHKNLGYIFYIKALTFYHAINQMEGILGAEKFWINDYCVLHQGHEVGYKVA